MSEDNSDNDLSTGKKICIGCCGLLLVLSFIGGVMDVDSNGNGTFDDGSGNGGVNYEDEEFVDWIVDNSEKIGTTCEFIGKEAQEYDYQGVQDQAALLEEQCNDALGKIDDFNLSPELDEVRKEYKKALIDYRDAADKAYRGAEYKDGALLKEAANKMNEGTAHVNEATDLAEKYKEN